MTSMNSNSHAPEERIPNGLKELSNIAIKKQIAVNEAIELAHLKASHFLRAFNGSVMDPEMIKERAQALMDANKEVAALLSTITTPYLD